MSIEASISLCRRLIAERERILADMKRKKELLGGAIVGVEGELEHDKEELAKLLDQQKGGQE